MPLCVHRLNCLLREPNRRRYAHANQNGGNPPNGLLQIRILHPGRDTFPSRKGGRFRHSHVRISPSVIKQVPFPLPQHPLHKHHVRNLPHFFPFFFRSKNRNIGSRNQFARIFRVEPRYPSSVHQFVVRPVVDQNNSLRRHENQSYLAAPLAPGHPSHRSNAEDRLTSQVQSDRCCPPLSPENTSNTCPLFSPAQSHPTSSSEHSIVPCKQAASPLVAPNE